MVIFSYPAKLLLVSSLLGIFSGCAFAPGPLFGPSLGTQNASGTPGASAQTGSAAGAGSGQPSTLVQFFQGKGSTLVTGTPNAHTPAGDTGLQDTPPPGVLRPITPELIRDLQAQARESESLGPVKALFGAPKPYTIGVGDVVHINVWGRPELMLPAAGVTTGADASGSSGVTNGFNVNPDGHIQFPLIGTLNIVGLTESQARLALTDALKRYIVDPQVTLRVQAYRAGRVYLDGEVRTPGLQPINDVPMTLPEALSRAGGLTANADRSQVFVTRNGVTTPINLLRLAEKGVNPTQILLKPNDLVRVGNTNDARVFVMGEVLRQASLPLKNGRLSLNEALGESGGINPTSGDPRQIFVIRSRAAQAGELPEIYHLDGSSAMRYALAEGFELKPRDVVYVDPVPLVRWNRVISLILPSAQAVNVTRDAIN